MLSVIVTVMEGIADVESRTLVTVITNSSSSSSTSSPSSPTQTSSMME